MSTVLTIYNLSVKIETNSQVLIDRITKFVEENYSLDSGGFSEDDEKVHVYAGNVVGTNECTFTTNQFKHLLHYLNNTGHKLDGYEIINMKDFSVEKVPYKLREGWELREQQVPVHEFVMKKAVDTKLLPLSMGSGKTFLALKVMADMGDRFAVIVLPRFQVKWREDIIEIHDATVDDVIMVSGKKSSKEATGLKNLIECAKSGAELKPYMVFSINTLYEFIKSYETDPSACIFEYGCTPFDLFPLLKVGSVLGDEVHMHYHQLFKILLYTNVKFLLGLSGTLISTSQVEENAHRAMFPRTAIYHDTMRRAYINFVYAMYGIDRDVMPKLRFTNKIPGMRGREAYSHIAFEKSLMRNNRLLICYFSIMSELIQEYYIDTYESGDRLIIFVSTIAMATEVTAYMQKQMPNKKVVRYCDDDKYEDMLKGEVIVTTVMSAGTGVDIPDLITGLQTISQASEKSNLQASGRLRFIEGREVTYVCMYSEQVKKQVRYAEDRKEMFRDFAKTNNTHRTFNRLTLDKRQVPYIIKDS